jgi:hypothetical protein
MWVVSVGTVIKGALPSAKDEYRPEETETSSIFSDFDLEDDAVDYPRDPRPEGITILSPWSSGIGSDHYHWLGHITRPGDVHWLFAQLKSNPPFNPFCGIESFEVIWKSNEGTDNQVRTKSLV